jgi:LuxR family transcriptional regulator, maltose regulon positive regulatory protein
MDASDVQERANRPHSTARLALDLYASKLHPPPMRRGTIRRSSLIKQLAHDDSSPIVSVVAPPGYGKTTLLSQ